MPCYNATPFIRAAIESVLNQTYSNFELIIVNDGSTDNSIQIIRSFSDSRIKIIHQENKGQSAASNYGYKKSKGVFIKFFDADDILSEKVLEKQVEVLRETHNSIAYMHWARFYNNDLNRKDPGPTQIKQNCAPLDYLTWRDYNTPMLQCAIWLFPKQLLELHGLWDERLSLINDTEFITRILLHADDLKFADNCSLLYRTNFNSGTLSQVISKKSLDSALLSIDLMSSHLLKKEHSKRVRTLIAHYYQMLREWSYPQYLAFVKVVEKRLLDYSDIELHYRKSGAIFNFIFRFLGWKTARFFQYYYYKIRYT